MVRKQKYLAQNWQDFVGKSGQTRGNWGLAPISRISSSSRVWLWS